MKVSGSTATVGQYLAPRTCLLSLKILILVGWDVMQGRSGFEE